MKNKKIKIVLIGTFKKKKCIAKYFHRSE